MPSKRWLVTDVLHALHTGLYFGREVPANSEEAKLPLHGPNQWPPEVHITRTTQLSASGRSAAYQLDTRNASPRPAALQGSHRNLLFHSTMGMVKHAAPYCVLCTLNVHVRTDATEM